MPQFVSIESKRFLAAAIAALVVLLSPDHQLQAARGNATEPPPTHIYELVVVEVEGCTYCDVFRRDVLPAYLASPRSKDLPLRFLDLNAPEAAHLVLEQGPLTVVPTLLLVKANREVSRVPGYLGPDNFFRSVQLMMNAAP
jgi:thioredoxin-related protein